MTGNVSGVAAYPLNRCKTIYLVRHGQGFHNVAGENNREAYMSTEYFDASLTAVGWRQVAALRNHVRKNGVADGIQLVVVSPLTRTLQTAVGAFGGEDVVRGHSDEALLMVDSVGMAKHNAVSTVGAPPFVAVEWCREHMGLHPCDQRQTISAYKSLFPGVDFSEVEVDEDVYWSSTERETQEQLFTRARKFVQWLLERKETAIAVVSHSSFFETSNADFCFQNCEMRAVVLVDKRSEGGSAAVGQNFPGGAPPGPDTPSDAAEGELN